MAGTNQLFIKWKIQVYIVNNLVVTNSILSILSEQPIMAWGTIGKEVVVRAYNVIIHLLWSLWTTGIINGTGKFLFWSVVSKDNWRQLIPIKAVARYLVSKREE